MPRINAVSFHEDPSIEAICRTIKNSGYDGVELSRPPFYEKLTTPETRRRFAEWTTEFGLSLYGFDCWVEVEPYEKFDETLAEFQRAVDWAADLNLGMIISHDSWSSVNRGRSPESCLKINVELFRRVAEMCAERQLKLVFEPHPDTLSMNNAWAVEFIDAVGKGQPPGSVGLVYDCCHYGVGQPNRYVASIEALGQRIQHLHFSDGDKATYALHLPIGDGELDLTGIVAALKRVGYRGTVTCDLYHYPLLEEGARRNSPRIAALESELQGNGSADQ